MAAAVPALLAQAAPQAARQDGAVAARLLAALAGLAILGFALVLLAWLGGRATRRYMKAGRPGGSMPDPDDWASKPLPPSKPPRP